MPTYTLQQFQQDLIARLQKPFGRATNDAVVMAITALGEARDQGLKGLIAVMQTLVNRVTDRPGKSITERALQKAQYSCWSAAGGQKDYEYVIGLAQQVMSGTALLPREYTEALYLAGGVLTNQVQNYAAGATHYCTRALLAHPSTTPDWTVGHTPVVVILDHAFFAHIPWS